MKSFKAVFLLSLAGIMLFVLAACSVSDSSNSQKESASYDAGTSIPESENTQAEPEKTDDVRSLTQPDKMKIYLGKDEYSLSPGEEPFSELFSILQKGWESSKTIDGYHDMRQAALLDFPPEDYSRIVFYYDEPITGWYDDKTIGLNTYVFFLNWTEPWGVICNNEEWEKQAVFPKLHRNTEEVMGVLKEYFDSEYLQ